MLFTVTDILAASASETLTPIKRREDYLFAGHS
jgi:hypothetical protein